MKRILAAILSLMLVFGCMSFAAAEEPTVVRLLWWGSQTRHDITVKAAEKFMEKNPDIKIEVEYTDWGGYWSKLATQVAGNVVPDVIAMNYAAYLTQYAENGVLEDLTPYFESGAIDTKNIAASVLESGRVGEGIYAISTGTNAHAFMYLPDVVEAAGITMPEEITMEEMYDMIKTVYEKTGRTATLNMGIETLRMTARNYGETLYNAEGSALGFTNPEYITRMWQRYLDCVEAGYTPGVGEETAASGFDAFVKDTWLGYANWTNELTAKETGSGCEVKMLPWPDWSDATSSARYLKPTMFWSMSANSQVKEEAARLVDFLINDPDCGDIIGLDRGVPISSVVRDHIAPNLDENNQEAAAILNYLSADPARTSPIDPVDPTAATDVSTLFNEYFEQVQYGMVDDLTAHAEAFMAEANDILAAGAAK